MSTKVPRCSSCREELKEYERYIASENWADADKNKQMWNEALKKRKDYYQNWFRKFSSHSNK